MANALIKFKRINTTTAKAKALKRYVEPLITKSKKNTMHSRRVVFSYLQDKHIVQELFDEVRLKIGDRPGGYVRVIKTGFRKGDGAETSMIELVDYNEVYVNPGKGEGTKSTTKSKRSRRGGKKKQGSDKNTAAAVAGATATKAMGSADDLKIVEGIGPKIEEILKAGGIGTWAALAAASASDIKSLLDSAEGNFAAHDPTTWPEQAKMAEAGDWDKLKIWQDELDGGKVVNKSEEE